MIEGLDQSIKAGVGYLETNQTASGRFRVWVSVDSNLPVTSTPEESVFASACILYNLEWLHTPEVESIRGRGLEFLRTESSKGGLFRYYASTSQALVPGGQFTLPFTVPFDVDTTSCASLILRRHGIEFDNQDRLLANRNDTGTFSTWMLQETLPETENNFPFVCFLPAMNSVCTGVNANVLCYLGERAATTDSVEFLITAFCQQTYLDKSDYYPDEVVLICLYSRAYFEGIESFSRIRRQLAECLLKHQRPEGSFGNVLQTALAICAMANLQMSWPGQEVAVHSLLTAQNQDGSWPRFSFYVGNQAKESMKQYLCFGETQRELPSADASKEKLTRHFGSEEITTAYCLEALSRYREAAL